MINTQSRSKWICFLLGSLLLISLLLSGCGMSWMEQRKVKVEVEQYLQEKYGKEFTVEKSYYYTSKLGSKTETISEGYPQDNPKVKIKVNTGSTGVRHDDYLIRNGISEANHKMQSVLDDIYGKDNAFPGVSCGFIDIDKYEQKWGRTPSIDELMGKYPDQMDYELCIAVFKDINPEQINDEFKNVYRIVEYMKSLKLKKNSLSVYYYLPTYKPIAFSVIREKGVRYIEDSKETYRIYIGEENFNKINSPEDIKKYGKPIKKI